MQLRKDKFYTTLKEKYGVEVDLSESVCNFIMSRWRDWQRMPDNLILDIAYLGKQVLRNKKAKDKFKSMVRKKFDYTCKENNTFRGPKEESMYDRDKQFLERLNYLLYERYEDYKRDRGVIQQERKEKEEFLPIDRTPIMLRKPIKPIDD